MSAWALRRQIGYAVVVLGLLALVVGIVIWQVFFTTPPDCFDGIMNQDERGVDCGGTCELFCQADVIEPIVRWVRAVPVTDEVYHAVALVENQNISSGLPQVPYTINVYDAQNILIAESSATTFLGPNQETLLFIPHIQTGNRTPYFADIEASWLRQAWVDAPEKFARTQITVENILWNRLTTNPKMSAEIQNVTLDDLYEIEFVAIIYDIDNNVMAASNTVVDHIDQGSSQEIFFTWPRPFGSEISKTEIIPRVNPFSDLNQ